MLQILAVLGFAHFFNYVGLLVNNIWMSAGIVPLDADFRITGKAVQQLVNNLTVFE